jgi:hypothetical protein
MVTLNSDDPPMFGASLLDEYTLDQLRELAANSVEASFLPPPANPPSSPASSNTTNSLHPNSPTSWEFTETLFTANEQVLLWEVSAGEIIVTRWGAAQSYHVE